MILSVYSICKYNIMYKVDISMTYLWKWIHKMDVAVQQVHTENNRLGFANKLCIPKLKLINYELMYKLNLNSLNLNSDAK